MSDHPLDRAKWRDLEDGQLIGRGHPAGDFLEAWRWEVLEEREGFLRLAAHVPEHVRNPRGQLFGGFTPTYVDLVALFTFRAGNRTGGWRHWLTTLRMEVEYLEPVVGDRIEIVSEITARRGRNAWVHTRFLGPEGRPHVLATTVLRALE
ncbi:MAG TPA: PaaI family thioesterase [Myxococcota bacterium]|nr:PaaI family thioesterase [Myxococcota bacterium]